MSSSDSPGCIRRTSASHSFIARASVCSDSSALDLSSARTVELSRIPFPCFLADPCVTSLSKTGRSSSTSTTRPPHVLEVLAAVEQRAHRAVVERGERHDEIVKDGLQVQPAAVEGPVLSQSPYLVDSCCCHPVRIGAGSVVPRGHRREQNFCALPRECGGTRRLRTFSEEPMTAQTGLEDGSSSRVVIQACGSDQRGPGPKCRRNLRTAVERRRRPYPSTQPPWRTLPRPSERLVQREGRSRLAEVSRLSRRRSIASCAPATRRAWTGRREALRGSPRVTLLLRPPSTPSIQSRFSNRA